MKPRVLSRTVAILTEEYRERQTIIQGRLLEFDRLRHASGKRLFEELCFCICTPQSNAESADKAIRRLKKHKLLYTGSVPALRRHLGGVRFPNNKSRYLRAAQSLDLTVLLAPEDDRQVRETLVRAVQGIGYKEASHFLRNVGRGHTCAILDVHILRNLKRFAVIRQIPASLTRARYSAIEERMIRFARTCNLSLRELDLVLWSRETGRVFK